MSLWPEMIFRGDLLERDEEISKRRQLNPDRQRQEHRAGNQAAGGAILAGTGAASTQYTVPYGLRELRAGGRAAASSSRAHAAGVAEEAKARPFRTTVHQQHQPGPSPSGAGRPGTSVGSGMQVYQHRFSKPFADPTRQAHVRQAASYFQTAQQHAQSARRLRGRGAAVLGGTAATIGGGIGLFARGVQNQQRATKKPRYIEKASGFNTGGRLVSFTPIPEQLQTIVYRSKKTRKKNTVGELAPPPSSHQQAVQGGNYPARVHKSWDEIGKRDRFAHRSIAQSEELARKARKRQHHSLTAAGIGATGIGISSSFGNVPHQTQRIFHSGLEGGSLAGSFRQVAGAARRNPAGAAALGSAALGVGAIGSWAANRSLEAGHNARANRRRKANYYGQRTDRASVGKAFPFKKTTRAARATNDAFQRSAGSFQSTGEKVGNLSDKVSNLLPNTKGRALAAGLGLATAAGTPSGVGSYLGNRPNRKLTVAPKPPSQTSKASPTSPDVSSKGMLKPLRQRRKLRVAS